MKQVNRKKICFVILICFLSAGTFAQNTFIFKGGTADGWVSQNTTQLSTAIFKGGNADGWAGQNFTQTNTNVFKGGSGDGWDSKNYIQNSISATSIFKGGTGDGWDAKNYLQSSTIVFRGGAGDGWDSKNFIQSHLNILRGGTGDGWDSKNKQQANLNIFPGGQGDGWASTYRPQGALPVTLLYFTAIKKDESSSLLNWQTSQEINSAAFDVERSSDAVSFYKIGTVTAAGNSSVPVSYSFIDHNPVKGMNYYRLKQRDLDGRFIYTPARLVRFDELNAETVKYYPNPTKGILNIEFSAANAAGARVVNIINESGAVVNQLKISSGGTNMQVDLSHYAKGVYFIQVRTATINSTERVILE